MKYAALAVLLVACGGTAPGGVVGRKDMGGDDDPMDLAALPGDFATLPLSARTWADETKDNDAGTAFDTLGGIWNNNSTAIAVGNNGAVIRKDRGSHWVADTSGKPSQSQLLATSGRGTTDAYAVGPTGLLWKYVGTEWSSGGWMGDMPPLADNFRSIWVAPDGLAFAEGDTSIIVRRANAPSNWTQLTGVPAANEYPNTIWGLMPSAGTYSVYLAGCQFTGQSCDANGGRIWHTDGMSISASESGSDTCDLVYGVWGASATDLYASCNGGMILHSTGDGTWTKQKTPTLLTANLLSISGAGPDEIYAVGSVDSGTPVVLHKYSHASDVWTRAIVPSTVTEDLVSVYATPYDVYAVGTHGVIIHK